MKLKSINNIVTYRIDLPLHTVNDIERLIKGSGFTVSTFISAVVQETVAEYVNKGGKTYGDN